jgi:hypothetical protein
MLLGFCAQARSGASGDIGHNRLELIDAGQRI